MSITTELAIVAQACHDEFQTLMMHVCLYAVIAFSAFFALRWLFRAAKEYVDRTGRGGRVAQFFALAATLAMILYGGTKPEGNVWRFIYANGLTDNGSTCEGNEIRAKWTVSAALLLDGYVLKAQYQDATMTNAVGEIVDTWHALEDGQVSDLHKTWIVPNATNMHVAVWAEYVEPVYVHTNGVYHLNGVQREMGGTQKYVTPGITIYANVEDGERKTLTPDMEKPESALQEDSSLLSEDPDDIE